MDEYFSVDEIKVRMPDEDEAEQEEAQDEVEEVKPFRLLPDVSEAPPKAEDVELPAHWTPRQKSNWLLAMRQRERHLNRIFRGGEK